MGEDTFMSRKTYSFNTTSLDALRYLLARDDELGCRFKEFFKDSMADKYREQLLQNPFTFGNYNVLNNIRNDCDMFFGTKDWFLCLCTHENELALLEVLNLDRQFQADDIPTSREDALRSVGSRVYRFKLMYSAYKSCNDEKRKRDILYGCPL